MAFQVSPGVNVTEKDLTNIVPAVSTSSGGIVITAEKGPIDEITTISSEQELADNFGKPTADNFEDIIFDEVGDEEVNFTSYVRTYPKIFKRV